MDTPLLLEGEAAEFLRFAEGTLQNKRILGSGPPFLKIGARILYDRDELLAWARKHRRLSTSGRETT